jgi:hypothetical protein
LPVVSDTRDPPEDASFDVIENASNGLTKVAATPPITDVLRKLRLENDVMIIGFGINKHTKIRSD